MPDAVVPPSAAPVVLVAAGLAVDGEPFPEAVGVRIRQGIVAVDAARRSFPYIAERGL